MICVEGKLQGVREILTPSLESLSKKNLISDTELTTGTWVNSIGQGKDWSKEHSP